MGKVVKMVNKKKLLREDMTIHDIDITKNIDVSDMKVAVIVSKFNANICNILEDSCINQLLSRGIKAYNITLIRVPGALEIPQMANMVLTTSIIETIIALGAVVRGDTYHFEIVANQSASALSALHEVFSNSVIINGILTTDNEQQALDRAEEKGKYCADAAIEMTELAYNLIEVNFDDAPF